MANRLSAKGKQKLDGYDGLCIWCYEVTRDDGKFQRDERWGIDFPIGTRRMLNQGPYKDLVKQQVSDAVDYNVTDRPIGGGAKRLLAFTRIAGDTASFKICFVATCNENPDDIQVSLENLQGEDEDAKWIRKGLIDDMVIGPAVAFVDPRPRDQIALLARYEGLKLASLLSQASFAGSMLDETPQGESEVAVSTSMAEPPIEFKPPTAPGTPRPSLRQSRRKPKT